MIEEKSKIKKIENPIKAILIPRLYERKNVYKPKLYNKHDYLGNKRHFNSHSGSKKLKI